MMYLIPKESMASKLPPAWVFLSGKHCHFEEVLLNDMRGNEQAYAVILPVHLHQDHRQRLMAVSLLIGEQEAIDMARFMFDIKTGAVLSTDLHDACLEACNVFGGCLIQSDTQTNTFEIGLPQPITMGRFIELQRHASECVTFKSEGDAGQRIVVTVFDAVEQSILEG